MLSLPDPATFVTQKKKIDNDVPNIRGHVKITTLPLPSKAKPSISFTDEEIHELTVMILNTRTKVVEAKASIRSVTLLMAYAAFRFLESSLHVLDGNSDIYACAYVDSDLTEFVFFRAG
ncbi:Malate dehydrogenase, chloroplastic [Linum perenne]